VPAPVSIKKKGLSGRRWCPPHMVDRLG